MLRSSARRSMWVALLGLAACAVSKDDRPLELPYLTQAIFAPSCGATQCHSTFRQAGNKVFDTPDGARRSLLGTGLIRFDSERNDATDAANADLILWITELDPFGLGIGRMPWDAPLPNKDVHLLIEWIENESPGAQCDPGATAGMACRGRDVYECTPDWNFGMRLLVCPNGCVNGGCKQ